MEGEYEGVRERRDRKGEERRRQRLRRGERSEERREERGRRKKVTAVIIILKLNCLYLKRLHNNIVSYCM